MESTTATIEFAPNPTPTIPFTYRFCQGLIRLWFALTFRKIRVLHEERLTEPDPALLMVSHQESFFEALILVAGFERQVRCLIPARLVKGLISTFLARGLGMIGYTPENRPAALETCRALLAEKAAVVTFLAPGIANSAGGRALATDAASIALNAESLNSGLVGLKLFPIHLFAPVGHTRTRELLVDVDQPEVAKDLASSASGSQQDRLQELARHLEKRCQENSFRLQPSALAEFLTDLEQALRDGLKEEFESRPEGKQKLDGFELSRFVVQWAEQMNYLHPGLLVSLREMLATWREACRKGALHRLETEGAGAWLSTSLGRAVVLLETVVGFPLAIYGLVNHLVALAILYWTGLLKNSKDRDKTTAWLWRGLVILGSYILEVIIIGHFWGRRGAGYYLPSLPLSGLYLWRYTWLLPHQSRIAFLSIHRSAETAGSTRLRKDFLNEISQALDLHAEMLGLPH
jgi:1-acyl-sn-glycerol-3-phosphate acyltransferase